MRQEQADADAKAAYLELSKEFHKAVRPPISKLKVFDEFHWTDDRCSPYAGVVNENRRLLESMSVAEIFAWIMHGRGDAAAWQDSTLRTYSRRNLETRQSIDEFFMAVRARGNLPDYAWARFGILFWSVQRSLVEVT